MTFPPLVPCRAAGVLCRACVALCLLSLCCLCAIPALARADAFRVVCVQAGDLDDYRHTLHGFALGLAQRGLLSAPPPNLSATGGNRALWSWLSKHTREGLRFLPDGFYSAAWNDEKLKEIRRSLQDRLATRRDVDAILVLGTRAGQDICSLATDVPIIAASVTNAVDAGIAHSADDSGRDNLVALIDTSNYRRQVEFFHWAFPFKKLGVVYEDTPTGRNVVALQQIEEAAAELGVELTRCHTQMHASNSGIVADNVEACHKKLVELQVDAVYLTYDVAMSPDQRRRTLEPLINAGLPTFAQPGTNLVKHGALISFVGSSREEGRLAARHLLAIRNGASPRALPQRFHSPARLAINLHTATYIGWNPPLEVLVSVDEFYE